MFLLTKPSRIYSGVFTKYRSRKYNKHVTPPTLFSNCQINPQTNIGIDNIMDID